MLGEIPDLFLVLNMISPSFAALTLVLEISRSTLEINLVFSHTHTCIIFNIYIYLTIIRRRRHAFIGINYFADLRMTFRQNFFLQDWFRNEFVVGLG
jgi:hypothetical protein